MSQPPSEERKAEQKGEKKPRSPVERIVVWGLIIVLAGLAGLEYVQGDAHKKHLKILQDAQEEAEKTHEPVLYEQIRGQMSKEPVITDANFGGATVSLYTWTWRGLKEHKTEWYFSKKSGQLLGPKLEESPRPKSDQKSASKADGKPEPKQDDKSGPKLDQKPESKTDEKPAPKADEKK